MNAAVWRQFGVKGSSGHVALSNQDWLAAERRQNLHVRSGPHDARRPDEDQRQRTSIHPAQGNLARRQWVGRAEDRSWGTIGDGERKHVRSCLEAVHLPPPSVTRHRSINPPEAPL